MKKVHYARGSHFCLVYDHFSPRLVFSPSLPGGGVENTFPGRHILDRDGGGG